ncbi:S1 family peptidase [Streptomyces sp. H27-D2]|uniref:S1 family peptidase n=1 Tax=Streptomyces sp. H27-D2 TaxID=3046304 RepID=UPI002DB9CFA6|nr:S1 family peptidase [Streptomyces sp. H27-D2]MEC4018616.1 S1 family peptidase [Streptomyces sp. H27-D2]
MSHRRLNKRTGAIAGAAAVALAAAAVILPNANASPDTSAGAPAAPATFTSQSAARLATTLAPDLGEKAAGWYLDAKSERMVVNVLDEDAADKVRAEGAVAKVVDNSMTELRAATRTLSDTASVPGTAWSIDPKSNRIVVIADRTVTGANMGKLNAATGGMDGMVTVKRSAGKFEPFDEGDGAATGGAGTAGDAGGAGDTGDASDAGTAGDVGGAGDAGDVGGADDAGGADDSGGADAAGGADDAGGAGDAADGGAEGGAGAGAAAAVDGGEAIFGGGSRCSLGFNVTVKGAPAFLTAGHCGNASATWTADEAGEQPLGTVAESTFPVSDFALVTYDDAKAEAPSSVEVDGASQDITGVLEASVGLKVQRVGSTTGLNDGTVTGLDATVNYGNGDIVNGLIQTDVCAEPGDSGGSLFSEKSAVGLTSGGSGDCTVGGETFFQPVSAALKATGAVIG